jgi:hypothetical protein
VSAATLNRSPLNLILILYVSKRSGGVVSNNGEIGEELNEEYLEGSRCGLLLQFISLESHLLGAKFVARKDCKFGETKGFYGYKYLQK